MAKTMKAIIQKKYGSADELQLCEVDRPTVGDDEVLVRVHAASLHPDVWHVVTGSPWVLRLMGAGVFRPKVQTPGTDMAGVVKSVGKNVTRFQPGDAVFGETILTMQWVHGGAFAEYVSVHNDLLALKPDNVTFEQAASVPTAAFIVMLNLRDLSELQPGRKVLINGAGGGVGSFALQLSKARGAEVTAVDSTSKLGMLRSLGADQVIDYTQENFTLGGARYDLIFDIPGNHSFADCRRVLKPDGRYVLIGHQSFGADGKSILGILPYFFKLMFLSRFEKQLQGPKVPAPVRKDVMVILRDLLESGKLTPIIDSSFTLHETVEAFRHMTGDDLHGKVIITVG